ncbi:MAG: glycosyltransferase family 2 protein [Planctomycetota bacterium]|nr:glycosyltransferase family 2 protein [Planctomycetota bacterium]
MNLRKAACAIVPCYNEEANIAQVVKEVLRHLDVCIVIDDCSTDRTSKVASEAGARVLRHERNMGKGMALKHGFALANVSGFSAAVTLDGDGQHDPEEIPRFLQAFETGRFDIVLGDRMGDLSAMPWVRRATNLFTSWCVTRMAGVPIRDSQVGFRLIRLDTWQALDLNGRRFDLESEIIIKACRNGARVTAVPIKTIYSGNENSKIRPFADTCRFFRVLWRCRNA